MIIIVPEVLQGRYDTISPKRQEHKQQNEIPVLKNALQDVSTKQ